MNKTQEEVREHRTLPREIIKWIQGLDLSYSVKDYRKDLNNGFLIAEIFSRYHPGKVQMHSFDSSQNSQRRKNNWDLLELFFTKNQIAIEKKEYDMIQKDNSEQLYDFICRIYTLLTQRKLPVPPLANSIPSGQNSMKNQNLTTSYLLKDKGLQKLDGGLLQKRDSNQQEAEKYEQDKPTSSPNKKGNFLRVPSKQISSNVEGGSGLQLDIKSINIRTVGDKGSRELSQQGRMDDQNRKIKEQQLESSSVDDKQLNENEIFDYLRQMIASNIEQQPEQKSQFQNASDSLTEIFSRRIAALKPSFVHLFFKQILASKQGFIVQLFKDQNQIWRFLSYFIDMFHKLDEYHESFEALIEIVGQFGKACEKRESGKTRYIFNEYLLPQLVHQVKMAPTFHKKSEIIKLVYDFCGEEPGARRSCLMLLKDLLKDHRLFMLFLAVLVEFQTSETASNRSLLDDMLYYANQYLFSSSVELRTLSLKIYLHLLKLSYPLVMKNLFSRVQKLAKMEWWQNACQVVILLTGLLERLTTTKDYLNLIKHPGNLAKCYNPQNQRLSNQMKEEVEELAQAIHIACKNKNPNVQAVGLAHLVPVVGEHKLLSKTFVTLLLEQPEAARLLSAPVEQTEQSQSATAQHSNTMQRYNSKINPVELLKHTSELLTCIVELIGLDKPDALSQSLLDLIYFCLQSSSLRTISNEAYEQICSCLVPLILVSVCDEQQCNKAVDTLTRLAHLYFYNDVKVLEFPELLAATITLLLQKKLNKQLGRLQDFLKYCQDEYGKSGSQAILRLLEHTRSELTSKGHGNTEVANRWLKVSPRIDTHEAQ